jgi:hypothetical protein
MNKPDPRTPSPRRSNNPIDDDAQRLFDTVSGPNLRRSDNLIQLAAVGLGGLASAIFGAIVAWLKGAHPMVGILLGGFAGVVVALFLSGAIIGVLRFKSAMKRR